MNNRCHARPPSPAPRNSESAFRLLDWIRPSTLGVRMFPLTLGAWLLAVAAIHAFPPAPHHTVYGSVRDEMGNPLVVTNAQVVFDALAGTQITTLVVPHLSPTQNYRLDVPMDAGLTADNYKPTAMRPTVAFRLKVRIGTINYLPIQMTGDYAQLGQPAQSTRLDLTLGEDLDGDGLPDAWERALMDASGLTGLHEIEPGDDADGDGLSNLQEYLAGTYAFDPQDGFRLDLVGVDDNQPLLEFLAIGRRHYVLYGSDDLITWQPLEFRLADEAPTAPTRRSYWSADVRTVRLRAEVPATGSATRIFKLQVQ